jgi:hypothetical protein
VNSPTSSDPNATVAGGTTGAGVLVVWLLGHFGVNLSAEVGAVIAGGAATVLLVIGRRGIKGTLQRIWSGAGK